MTARSQASRWAAQRASAMVLAVCVLVHLVTIVYAVLGGLSAAEILERTRGSYAWAAFYGVFVLAVAVHGAVGVRAVLLEWLGLRGKALTAVVHLTALVIVVLGMCAVWAVIA